jgi:hypothetical protein
MKSITISPKNEKAFCVVMLPFHICSRQQGARDTRRIAARCLTKVFSYVSRIDGHFAHRSA